MLHYSILDDESEFVFIVNRFSYKTQNLYFDSGNNSFLLSFGYLSYGLLKKVKCKLFLKA